MIKIITLHWWNYQWPTDYRFYSMHYYFAPMNRLNLYQWYMGPKIQNNDRVKNILGNCPAKPRLDWNWNHFRPKQTWIFLHFLLYSFFSRILFYFMICYKIFICLHYCKKNLKYFLWISEKGFNKIIKK